MSYNYQCSKLGCRKRATFKHKIEWYIEPKLCPDCGKDSLKFKATDKARNKRRMCRCDGYSHPHKTGDMWCRHNTRPISDEDMRDRYESGYHS